MTPAWHKGLHGWKGEVHEEEEEQLEDACGAGHRTVLPSRLKGVLLMRNLLQTEEKTSVPRSLPLLVL